MNTPHEPGAFVAHTGTDVYGPGKVIGVDGDLRRVRFVHFVATIRAHDLRPASPDETAQVTQWLQQRRQKYGGQW